MTALGSVSIDRTSLSLSPLVIDTDGFGTYYVDSAGLGRVGRTVRETVATSSPFVHGILVTGSVYDDAALPLVVRVQASTTSALDTAVTALETALAQFSYSVTVVMDGVTKVWTARPATIQSTDALIDFARVTNHIEDLTISIPVYPVSA